MSPSSDQSDELAFNYEDLWYIKLIDGTNKNPLEKWGGYSQDFETSDTVYSHEEVLESEHEYWGICGIRDKDHMSRALLIYDLDIYKASDDFDPDDVKIPTNWPVVKSQSGGLHVYTFVHAERGEGSISDFAMTKDLEWDIDIRGSYVSHHVVAPADIPGVGGRYELANDTTIPGTTDPSDSTARILYKGEPLLEHDSNTGVGNFSYERDTEPPEDMPTCYARGLQLRAENPDDHPDTHKVNTLTGLCGLAAGYSIDDMVEHFCDEEQYAPGPNADTEKTRYHLELMADKMDDEKLAPPSIATLREWGILDEGETCDCDIEYHGGRGWRHSQPVGAQAAATDGGASNASAQVPEGGELETRSHPVYDVLENEGVELHLEPINGEEIRLVVRQNGHREYNEVQERGFWDSGAKRGQIAGRVAGELTGVDQEALKSGVKSAIAQISLDSQTDAFDEAIRSPREQELRDRTVKVVCHPAADAAEWVVTMLPPDGGNATGQRDLTFNEGQLNDANAGALRNAYLASFYEKLDIDAGEWYNLSSYWLDIAEIREREIDHRKEAAVSKFMDWVESMPVWADEAGFTWGARNGYYAEGYHEGQDAILVPGQKVVDWQQQETLDDVNLSVALREEGKMLRPSRRETIHGEQRSVWPVAAGETPHTAENAHRTIDEDEDDGRPEGLR